MFYADIKCQPKVTVLAATYRLIYCELVWWVLL